MASTNKITEVIAAIKTIYPYYAKEADVQMLVKTWSALLKNYADDAVTAALYMCLQKCKMPPTPADMIEQLNALARANEPTDEELWDNFRKSLHRAMGLIYRFPHTFVEENGKTQGDNARADFDALWKSLPAEIRAYLGGKGEFMRLARCHNDEELKYERTRFLKTIPTIKQREETRLQLTAGTGAAIGLLTER